MSVKHDNFGCTTVTNPLRIEIRVCYFSIVITCGTGGTFIFAAQKIYDGKIINGITYETPSPAYKRTAKEPAAIGKRRKHTAL